ncbi:MAG TPA: hypothetical protein VMS00_07485 [Acidimicrobiales bacterium]|nr:hypothetical protein [Acidimicrobiales bacterium]
MVAPVVMCRHGRRRITGAEAPSAHQNASMTTTKLLAQHFA